MDLDYDSDEDPLGYMTSNYRSPYLAESQFDMKRRFFFARSSRHEALAALSCPPHDLRADRTVRLRRYCSVGATALSRSLPRAPPLDGAGTATLSAGSALSIADW